MPSLLDDETHGSVKAPSSPRPLGSARRLALVTVLVVLGLVLLVKTAIAKGWTTPDVRGRVMVVYARRGLSDDSWAGMMSEFHAALGALAYAEQHGAAGVRFHFDSSIYVDASRGPNWWAYFFEPETIWLGGHEQGPSALPEVHLNDWLARYGRMGGFGHIVYGAQSHLYPMTFGLDRATLHRLISSHFQVRDAVQAKVQAFKDAHFGAGDFVLGLHYRGLDTVVHWPFYRIDYEAFIREAEHAIRHRCRFCDVDARRGFKVFVATDEIQALDAVRARFGESIVVAFASPRASAHSHVPLHKDASIANYDKGESVLIDSLLLAATDYVVKGRSSVSEASLAFNPLLPYSFFVTKDLIYRDSMPSTDQWLGPDAVIRKE